MWNSSSLPAPGNDRQAPSPLGPFFIHLGWTMPLPCLDFQVERQVGRGHAGVDGGRELGEKGSGTEHTHE